jgi:hypothetical protein
MNITEIESLRLSPFAALIGCTVPKPQTLSVLIEPVNPIGAVFKYYETVDVTFEET